MTMVFAFKFSDHEYFTNKCMSFGILAINQIILFLKPKRLQCVSAVFVLWFPADIKLAIASIYLISNVQFKQSSTEMLNVSLKNNGFICLVLKYQYYLFRSQ